MKRLYKYTKANREGLLLQVDDEWGEIAPLPGWSKESLGQAQNEILQVLFENKQPTLPSVIFGLSTSALTPIRIPLCALHRPHDGCTTLKLKLGHLTVDDAIACVKQYVGKYRLRIDCNRKWTLLQALCFAKHFLPSDFEYWEEPVDDLIQFSKMTNFPIALDETLRENIDIPTAKFAVIKPTLTGVIPNISLPIVLSSSYESSIGILQIARLGNPKLAHGLDTFTPDYLNPPITVENGYLTWFPSKNPIDTSKLCLIASAP